MRLTVRGESHRIAARLRWALSVALPCVVLGFSTLLSSGCRRGDGDGDELNERRSVHAELSIYLVADRHPWVIALLTELAARVESGTAGTLEAELGSRGGLAGERGPDPIMRAHSRAELERVLSEYEALHPRPPDLRPIWIIEDDPGQGEPKSRLHFVQTGALDGFRFDSDTRTGIRDDVFGPLLLIQLSPTQRPMLAELSERIRGDRLALLLDDEVLMMPMVVEAITGGEFVIHTGSSATSETATALLERIVGD